MCGINGFVDFAKKTTHDVLIQMTNTLYHRGPNDLGVDFFEHHNAFIGLGQTRLSVIDLSKLGHQPMKYKNLWIVFNGEIYNYKEIKIQLETLGHFFNSDSDTEVILHAYDQWGNECVNKFIGMFVFVIYDSLKEEIIIIRDRAGVKPIYYYWDGTLFLFSSELKSFHKHPLFIKKINKNAVAQFIDYGYIPAPSCIFLNTYKLNPGTKLFFSLDKATVQIEKYWDVYDYYKLPKLDVSYEKAKEKIEELLISAFEYRMIADVPLGVFLSGGYDSTALASIIQFRRPNQKIKTFTIGFDEANDEAPFAKKIADYIGTEHTEYYCSVKEAQDIISELPFYFDEPFADSSAIPTIIVSRIARDKVTVALSADGGDEIFAGYSYYKQYLKIIDSLNKVPFLFNKVTAYVFKGLSFLFPIGQRFSNRMDILSVVLSKKRYLLPVILQHRFFQINRRIKKGVLNFDFFEEDEFDNNYKGFSDPLSIALSSDYKMYLQSDILTKVDRATMSVSLEGREPFLDHRIVEFVAQLPNEYKFDGNIQKRILKDIVHKYVPVELMDRPKSGFSIPLEQWLKGDLKEKLLETLNDNSIRETGLFNHHFVEKLKSDFFSGSLHDISIIWKLFQFQLWYKKWMN